MAWNKRDTKSSCIPNPNMFIADGFACSILYWQWCHMLGWSILWNRKLRSFKLQLYKYRNMRWCTSRAGQSSSVNLKIRLFLLYYQRNGFFDHGHLIPLYNFSPPSLLSVSSWRFIFLRIKLTRYKGYNKVLSFFTY